MFYFFNRLARAEWDTLLFFYGVVMCVGGPGFIGYLSLVSTAMYIDLGPTFANIAVGVLSVIVDNIPSCLRCPACVLTCRRGNGSWSRSQPALGAACCSLVLPPGWH